MFNSDVLTFRKFARREPLRSQFWPEVEPTIRTRVGARAAAGLLK